MFAFSRCYTCFIALLLFIALDGLLAQEIRRVAPTSVGEKDGSSWENAMSLHQALTESEPGDQVWVMKGSYVPNRLLDGSLAELNPREATFEVQEGVSVYGGFAGTESIPGGRDMDALWTTNRSSLSGKVRRGCNQEHHKRGACSHRRTGPTPWFVHRGWIRRPCATLIRHLGHHRSRSLC